MVEFDWDDGNLEHIALHGVEPDEAEAVLLSRNRVALNRRTVRGEVRMAYVAQVDDGAFLVAVVTRRDGRLRVVTARQATMTEVSRWRRARK